MLLGDGSQRQHPASVKAWQHQEQHGASRQRRVSSIPDSSRSAMQRSFGGNKAKGAVTGGFGLLSSKTLTFLRWMHFCSKLYALMPKQQCQQQGSQLAELLKRIDKAKF
eukprot:1161447-Pelagomonas_calceolata.AAC.8